MKVDIKKYFWQLKPSAIKETEKILKNPSHPRFVEKMYTLLTRCDKPKEVFSLISKEQFIKSWPKVRRYWMKKRQAEDFRYWWEAIYENLIKKKGKKIQREGSSSIFKRIGEIIREKRIGKNYSQKDLAIKVGLRQPDISKIEKGKVNITLETLIRLCRVLDIKNIPLKE
jgi:ribosome-binding protein aMBF1 (putative translation factor)